MNYNNERKYDDCCCKCGVMCALSYIRDLLMSTYPPNNISPIQNIYIYGKGFNDVNITTINNITTDIVAINAPTNEQYLSLCNIYYSRFIFNENLTDEQISTIEADIKNRFENICYTCSTKCCCKNGIIDTLIKARTKLNDEDISNITMYFDNLTTPIIVDTILAINNDTVWLKYTDDIGDTTYYFASICEISSIEFNVQI